MAKSKLTDEQKAEAYRLYVEEKYTYKQIAQKFDISIPTAAVAVGEYEQQHRWDDPAKAPLACDQTGTGAQSEEPTVPPCVVDAVSDTIVLLGMEIDARVQKIEEQQQGIKEQQREVEAMRARLAELRKWKEAQS